MTLEQDKIALKFNEILDAGDVAQIDNYLHQHPFLFEHQSFSGTSMLHYACSWGPLGSVKRLVERGFDVNMPGSREGILPIGRALTGNHPEIVEYLIQQGAALNTDNSAENPFFSAVIGKSYDSIDILLAAGADPARTYGEEEVSATAFALLHGQTDIALKLAQYISAGDKKKKETYLARAKSIAHNLGPVQPTHIIPPL